MPTNHRGRLHGNSLRQHPSVHGSERDSVPLYSYSIAQFQNNQAINVIMNTPTSLPLVMIVAVAVLSAGVSGRMAGRLPGGFGVLPTDFNCDNRPFGYYADVDHGCRAFHVCMPVYGEDGALAEVAHFSFMCGQNAVFSQDSLTCAHPTEALSCDLAAAHYDVSNAEFGIVPEENLDVTVE